MQVALLLDFSQRSSRFCSTVRSIINSFSYYYMNIFVIIIKMIKRALNLVRGTGKFHFSVSYDANKDYFKILGVQKSASDAQIKSAYYKLAMKYHPDHNKGHQAKFKQINQAYSVLSDSKAKRDYQNSRSGSGPSQSYQNYEQTYNRGYQDPFRTYNNASNQQRTYYERNPYNEWQRNSQGNDQWSSRNYYQNPYEAYDKFRKQYEEADQERIRRRQKQYEEYMRQQDQFNEQVADNLKKSVRLSFIIALFLSLFLFASQSNRQKVYVDPRTDAYYQVVSINGSPFLQKAPQSGPYPARPQDNRNYY